MMTLDFVLNTAGLTACTVVANEKISYSTAFMFSLTKEVISAQLGGGLAGFAAGILGGMVVTKVIDPEHRMAFRTAVKVEGCRMLTNICFKALFLRVAVGIAQQ